MEYTPEIGTALNIYADETCSSDEKGSSFHVYSENPEIKKQLEELFYDTINVEFNLRPWIRNLVKYGDFFLFNEVLPEVGVINVSPIPVNELSREEGFDQNDPSAIRFRMLNRGNKILEAWQVTHFRIQGNDLFLPYGTSILENARRTWRQLVMIEDAMLVYRVVRSPERRVFYIDVGNTAPNDIPAFMEQAKATLKSNLLTEKEGGRQDERYQPIDVTEDYLIPVRGTESGTRIETLAGGQHVSATEDVEYIQKKLFSALNIPRAYLGFDESLSCFTKETEVSLLDGRDLSMENIRKELLEGKELWTYSYDLENKKLVPGKITDAWEAKKTSQLVKVVLDNGESFTCTPEHKWLNREGQYVEAQNLKQGDSLMPLYKRITGKTTGKRNLIGYEEIYEPGSDKWLYTHKWVDSHFSKEHFVKNRRVIHHVDFNKRNNSPKNLLEMNFDDHRTLHQQALATTKQKALLEGKYSGLNNGYSKKCLETVKEKYDLEKLISWCRENKPSGKKEIFKKYGLGETWFNRLLAENNVSFVNFAKENISGGYKNCRKGNKRAEFTCHKCGCEFKASPSRGKSKKHYCSASCRYNNSKLNHTVFSVETLLLESPVGVWDITVDKYHNFALKNGTIVKNSKATLAQEDIRFSRTITIIQKIIIAELNKLAMLHLYAKGFDGEDLIDFELFLSNPSSVALQQKLALWNDRIDIAAKFKESLLVDQDWIREEILGFTPEERNRQKVKIKEDVLFQKEIEAIAVSTENQERQAIMDPFDQSNYQVPGADVPKTRAPETQVSDKELLANISQFDTDGQVLRNETPPGASPIAPSPLATQRRRNDKRRVGMGGDFNLQTPNFKRMLDMGGENNYNTDITDNEFLSRRHRNESVDIAKDLRRRPGLPSYFKKTLKEFDQHFNINKNKILMENLEEKLDEAMNPPKSEEDAFSLLLEGKPTNSEKEIDLEIIDEEKEEEDKSFF